VFIQLLRMLRDQEGSNGSRTALVHGFVEAAVSALRDGLREDTPKAFVRFHDAVHGVFSPSSTVDWEAIMRSMFQELRSVLSLEKADPEVFSEAEDLLSEVLKGSNSQFSFSEVETDSNQSPPELVQDQ